MVFGRILRLAGNNVDVVVDVVVAPAPLSPAAVAVAAAAVDVFSTFPQNLNRRI